MKKLFTILSFLAIVILMSSCKRKPSLQSYLVESQGKKGFITVDVPSSVLKMTSGKEVSETTKEAMESIRKVNIVALPYKDNEAAYEIEKDKLKSIFSNSPKYKSLITMKDKRGNMNLYYSGSSDKIDEIIAFGYGKELGVGVARIIGNNMNPGKIMEAMRHVNFDGSDVNLSQFKKIFENANKSKVIVKVDKSKE